MKITKTKKGYTAVIYLGQTPDKKCITKRVSGSDRPDVIRKASEYLSGQRIYGDSMVFEDALERYISAREPHRSASTIRSYKAITRRLKTLYSDFCALNLNDITDDAVQNVINDAQRRGYYPKTLKNWTGLINSVLIAEKRPSVHVLFSQPVIHDREIPTIGEVKMMLCLLHGQRLEIPVKLALLGLRRGEICALSPSDLDADDVLHVHRSRVLVDGGGCVTNDSPKNDTSNRYVQLSPDLADMIRKRGITDLTPNALTSAFSAFLKKYRFPPYRLHDCRHFFASYCHSIGIPEADILAGGGWKTPNIMRSVYRHSMSQNRASAAINNLFG